MARPRKPTHLKIVTGTLRRDRTNANEPTPRRTRPKPPAHLSDFGRAAWTEIAAIADTLGVLTAGDVLALEGLAEAVGDLRAARASLAEALVYEGATVAEGGARFYWTSGAGGPMRRPRPELAAIADADRRVCSWVARFGLSPSDRSKVTAAPPGGCQPVRGAGGVGWASTCRCGRLRRRRRRWAGAGLPVGAPGLRPLSSRPRPLRRQKRPPGWRYGFDAAKAERVCAFIEHLPHTKGQWASNGERLRLEPWQSFILVNVFAFTRPDGRRRFRELMTVVPRKNGKSSLSAAMGLFLLCADGEHGAEIYSGATSEKQSWEVFRPARLWRSGRRPCCHIMGSLSPRPIFTGYRIRAGSNRDRQAWRRRLTLVRDHRRIPRARGLGAN